MRIITGITYTCGDPAASGKGLPTPQRRPDCCKPEAQIIKSLFLPLFPFSLQGWLCRTAGVSPKVIAPASPGLCDAWTPREEAELKGDAQLAVPCCSHSCWVSVGSPVSQQPSQGDCAAEKCDIKSCEALPLERSGLKAPGLF